MATTEPSPAPGPNRPPRTRTRRPRRGGHRNNGPAPADANANANTNATPNPTAQVPNGPLALRPASVAPLPDSNSPAPSNPRNSNANNRGGGNGRRGGFGRGGRRGGGRGQPMANGRVFGGQLTSNSHTSPTSDAGSLAGDAPAFAPGHPIATRPGPSRAPRARRMSKSQAADLATRTHEDITNGQYECAICTNEVLPNSKIWNCKTCWSVLHLSCVKKWSKNEVSTHQQRAVENGELPPPRQWRCPGCNLPKEDLPISYTCWCEKEIEPRSVAGLPPHSCGQSCSKKRIGHCPHPCDLMCHAGPTKADGLVGKSAMMYFPVENIIVNGVVMRAFVAVVRFLLNQHAIVVKSKKLYLARNAMKSVKVKHQPVRLMVKVLPRGHGLDLLTVALNAVDLLIAVNQAITVRLNATLKTYYPHTVHCRPMLSQLAPAGKHQFLHFSKPHEPIAPSIFLTVKRSANCR
ncbi:hypothetical protein BGAL_0115g00260 [Botrytis galanthina]|uniref:RING-type domain-containing protein n=1 Tax=Botrytis galanthina TaxID=278940 RepID=A0A4S8RD09_9HELO|nr:hypothetical protein BGAL_0115g00260 [Botrytis galanthina]